MQTMDNIKKLGQLDQAGNESWEKFKAFNDAVTTYNTAREKFPNVMIASTFGFQAAELFEIEVEEQREAPKVEF